VSAAQVQLGIPEGSFSYARPARRRDRRSPSEVELALVAVLAGVAIAVVVPAFL
jgi:hypothetical protein